MFVTVTFKSRATRFAVDNPDDHIQAHHVRGEFYELPSLITHSQLIPMHGTVLDIGANLGNHTLFYAQHTWAGRIYSFEPNPRARHLLARNIAANDGYRAVIDLEYAPLAISSAKGRLKAVEPHPNNLGGTQFVPSEDGIEGARLDDLNFQGHIAFIKIDVEGGELRVLAGGSSLIRRFRPVISVEIAERNETEFWEWMRENRYQVIGASYNYLHCKDYLIIPSY